MILVVLAVALGPSLIVFGLGCALALYRTHGPQPRRRYPVAQDRSAG
jgi:hypothetical protein